MEPLACDLKELSPAQRARHRDLMERLRTAVLDRTELPDGYVYRLRADRLSPQEFREWIELECLCCKFLPIEMEVESDAVSCLTLRGPSGTKDVLRHEFP
jgi:hypothetical protein